MPCWLGPIRAATPWVMWLCACVRYGPHLGVGRCSSVLKLVMCSERQWKSTWNYWNRGKVESEGIQPFLASPFPKFHLRLLLGGKKGSIVEMWTAESRFNKIPVWKEQEKTMLSHRPWQWRGDNHCGPKYDPEGFVARTVRSKCRLQTAADHCFHQANDGEKTIATAF